MVCLKRLAIVLFLGSIGIAVAFDNTLDLSEQTQQQKQDLLSQNNNIVHTQNPLTWEFGIGYIHSGFKATQHDGAGTETALNHSTSTSSNGVEIFTNANYYLSNNAGLRLGFGLEFMPLAWKNPLNEISYSGFSANETDFLITDYITFGGFYNLYRGSGSTLRVFADIGLGINFLFGGTYNGSLSQSCSLFYCFKTFSSQAKFPITIPIVLGMRYSFAKGHGIEAVLKKSMLNMDYTITTSSLSTPYTTSISHGIGFGLRYVYEFK